MDIAISAYHQIHDIPRCVKRFVEIYYILATVIFFPIGAYIYWHMFKEIADEFGWMPVIFGIAVLYILVAGLEKNNTPDGPIGGDRF